jgi:uncharacterized protein (UPF0264 family)
MSAVERWNVKVYYDEDSKGVDFVEFAQQFGLECRILGNIGHEHLGLELIGSRSTVRKYLHELWANYGIKYGKLKRSLVGKKGRVLFTKKGVMA